MEVAGQLNYKGDIRSTMQPRLMESERYGAVIPVAVEYDEAADLTRVSFAPYGIGVPPPMAGAL